MYFHVPIDALALALALVAVLFFALGFVASAIARPSLVRWIVLLCALLVALYLGGLAAGAAWVTACPGCTDSDVSDMSRRNSYIALALASGLALLLLCAAALAGVFLGRMLSPPVETRPPRGSTKSGE